MAKYTPRTKAPSATDKNWIHTSYGGYNYCIHIKDGSCLPNCVGYAWGRWRELLGDFHNLSRGNAEIWWGNTGDGYERGQTPKVGAVICWSKGKAGVSSDGAGHVAIVEQVNADGSILTSNSNYSGTRFYTKTFKPPYSLGGTYTFQGFIYLPIEFEEEKQPVADDFFPAKGYFALGDTHENIGKIADFMYRVFPAYTSRKALGNYYGNYIYTAIKEFQRRTGITVDGICGPQTVAELEKYGFKR